jgi:hypothetical protein
MDKLSPIIIIGKTPILINMQFNDLEGILDKILQWIELILNYAKLLDSDELFKDFNLDDTFFTQEMRLASLGKEYKNWKIIAKDLHDNGEMWLYDKLIITSNTGLIEWYCNKFNLTSDEYKIVCDDKNIQLLGAFYHRMKIIIENIYKIFIFFSGKNIYKFFNISCIKKLLLKPDLQIKNSKVFIMCNKIKKYYETQEIQENLTIKYLNLEKALELSQVAIFNYIRNKTFYNNIFHVNS